MGEQENVELARPFQEWPKLSTRELLTFYRRPDLYCSEAVARNHTFQFSDGRFWVLHRNGCHSAKTMGIRSHVICDPVIDQLSYPDPRSGIDPVVEEWGRRRVLRYRGVSDP